MAVYTGAVIPIKDDDTAIGVVSDDDFPFLAIVSDQDGNVVAQFPVRTEADGAAWMKPLLNSPSVTLKGSLSGMPKGPKGQKRPADVTATP